MDEKLDLLMRAVKQQSANRTTGVACQDIPALPEGIILPADSVRGLRTMASQLSSNSNAKNGMVSTNRNSPYC